MRYKSNSETLVGEGKDARPCVPHHNEICYMKTFRRNVSTWNEIAKIIERRWTQINTDKDGLIKEFQDYVQSHIKLVSIQSCEDLRQISLF